MTLEEQATLIRQYAAGDVTWHALRERGFDTYVGVRPGPNVEARQRGIAFLRQRFQEQTAS